MNRRLTPAYLFYGVRNVLQRKALAVAGRTPLLRRWMEGHFARRFGRVSYSQFGEDLALARLFSGERGTYVDVGAFDPHQYSNTAIFYARGWSGVNIDANPRAIERFNALRPRDVNLHSAVSNEEAEVEFDLFAFGAFNRIHGAGDPVPATPTQPTDRIRLRTRRLADLLAEAKLSGPIDFLSVDCEGHDLKVLQSNDWTTWRPKAVVIEDHEPGPTSPIRSHLEALGYTWHCCTGLSSIFLDPAAFPDGSSRAES